MEGQRDMVSRLIIGVMAVTIWLVGIIIMPIKFFDPPSRARV